MLADATACPQVMAGPTDIRIMNASLEQREDLIEMLCDRSIQGPDKPRTYMEDQIFDGAKFTGKAEGKNNPS
jgi:IS5 family transposase